MSILETVDKFYCEDEGEQAIRAAFEAAMKKRIEEEGFKMSDLLYEVYRLQVDVRALKETVFHSQKKPAKKKDEQ